MDPQALIGAEVELSAPDGRVFRFRVMSLVPYAGEVYAVLEHKAEDGQLLVTLVEAGADEAPVFTVIGDEEIISGVLEQQVARAIALALEKDGEEDGEDGCRCGHDLHDRDHSCSCGHDHSFDSQCHCGHHHRPLPSYIKKQQ